LFNNDIAPAIFTHHTAAANAVAIPVTVTIESFEKVLTLETDESYTLKWAEGLVDGNGKNGFTITAKTQLGAIHAFETLTQLVYFNFDTSLYMLPWSCSIQDTPRFKHRGLMIDTGRHYQPIPQIEKTLRAMRQNKLSVLHWHLVEIQSFPVQSKVFPELSQKGAWSVLEKYTLEDMAYIVDYARKQGIRVVPELDQPGHTGSMWYSHPELFACEPVFDKSGGMGSFGIAINPLDEKVFTFMNKLVGELLTIFPDQYFHIGTDEVPEDCWKKLPGDPNQFLICTRTLTIHSL
jgi:hexosaminidase